MNNQISQHAAGCEIVFLAVFCWQRARSLARLHLDCRRVTGVALSTGDRQIDCLLINFRVDPIAFAHAVDAK
jgi:hypothetical protein